jgi:hypothetical protein
MRIILFANAKSKNAMDSTDVTDIFLIIILVKSVAFLREDA